MSGMTAKEIRLLASNGRFPVRFAPRQKLPDGYRVEWWECDEMYHWVWLEDDVDGWPGTYSVAFCNRWMAYRAAHAHEAMK